MIIFPKWKRLFKFYLWSKLEFIIKKTIQDILQSARVEITILAMLGYGFPYPWTIWNLLIHLFVADLHKSFQMKNTSSLKLCGENSIPWFAKWLCPEFIMIMWQTLLRSFSIMFKKICPNQRLKKDIHLHFPQMLGLTWIFNSIFKSIYISKS